MAIGIHCSFRLSAALAIITFGPLSAAAEPGLVLLTSDDNGFCALARVQDAQLSQAEYDDTLRASVSAWVAALPLPPRLSQDSPSWKQEVDCGGDKVVLRDPQAAGHGYLGIGLLGITATAPPLWSFERSRTEDLSMANYTVLATVLQEQYGFPQIVPLVIDRVLVGNLDADPALERLIQASWSAMTIPHEGFPRSTGYHLLILAEPDRAPRVLAGHAWLHGSMEFEVFDLPIELLMVADLTADGLPEIAYSHGYGGALVRADGDGSWHEVAQCSFLSDC